nr:MAG TPA: hypothetical protein [Caudoviricetes sp.]
MRLAPSLVERKGCINSSITIGLNADFVCLIIIN